MNSRQLARKYRNRVVPLTQGQQDAIDAYKAYRQSCGFEGQYKPDQSLQALYFAKMKLLSSTEAWRVMAILEGRG